MDTQNFSLTKKGREQIQGQYRNLLKVRAMKLQSGVPKAWQSEEINHEFIIFREEMEILDAQISYYEGILKNARPVFSPRSRQKQKIVGLGAMVTLRIGQETQNFQIVSSLEANPSENKISPECAVGKALIGHTAGEKLPVRSLNTELCRIVSVRYQFPSRR